MIIFLKHMLPSKSFSNRVHLEGVKWVFESHKKGIAAVYPPII